jgi:hypothetical protein
MTCSTLTRVLTRVMGAIMANLRPMVPGFLWACTNKPAQTSSHSQTDSDCRPGALDKTDPISPVPLKPFDTPSHPSTNLCRQLNTAVSSFFIASISLAIAHEIEESVCQAYELGVCHTPTNINGDLIVGRRCICAYHSFFLDLKILTVFLDLCVDDISAEKSAKTAL